MLLKLSGTTGATTEVSEIPAHAKRIAADGPCYLYPIWALMVWDRCGGRPKNIIRAWVWNYGRSHETDVWCEVSD